MTRKTTQNGPEKLKGKKKKKNSTTGMWESPKASKKPECRVGGDRWKPRLQNKKRKYGQHTTKLPNAPICDGARTGKGESARSAFGEPTAGKPRKSISHLVDVPGKP